MSTSVLASRPTADTCCFCGSSNNLSRCGRCYSVQYCSKEHQVAHWKSHKKTCTKLISTVIQPAIAAINDLDEELQGKLAISNAQEVQGSRLASYPNNSENCAFNLKTDCKSPVPSDRALIPFFHSNSVAMRPEVRLDHIARQVIQDLDTYGVCCIDNLLGEKNGDEVLREVLKIHNSGALPLQDGQLVKEHKENGPLWSSSIRGDKIAWVEKKEKGFENITSLIDLIDRVIMLAGKMENNGQLGSHSIRDRTKAMISCYPGSGSKYVKHVDNPNKDGRCVTAIYYLNKNWNTKVDGGLLRIFPEGWPDRVADIEPLFDRLLFFWSDRRNPHEVQPAFKKRYAITLWYFDSKEKELAKAAKTSSSISSNQHASVI